MTSVSTHATTVVVTASMPVLREAPGPLFVSWRKTRAPSMFTECGEASSTMMIVSPASDATSFLRSACDSELVMYAGITTVMSVRAARLLGTG